MSSAFALGLGLDSKRDYKSDASNRSGGSSTVNTGRVPITAAAATTATAGATAAPAVYGPGVKDHRTEWLRLVLVTSLGVEFEDFDALWQTRGAEINQFLNSPKEPLFSVLLFYCDAPEPPKSQAAFSAQITAAVTAAKAGANGDAESAAPSPVDGGPAAAAIAGGDDEKDGSEHEFKSKHDESGLAPKSDEPTVIVRDSKGVCDVLQPRSSVAAPTQQTQRPDTDAGCGLCYGIV